MYIHINEDFKYVCLEICACMYVLLEFWACSSFISHQPVLLINHQLAVHYFYQPTVLFSQHKSAPSKRTGYHFSKKQTNKLLVQTIGLCYIYLIINLDIIIIRNFFYVLCSCKLMWPCVEYFILPIVTHGHDPSIMIKCEVG
jgi:cobalamin synthase